MIIRIGWLMVKDDGTGSVQLSLGSVCVGLVGVRQWTPIPGRGTNFVAVIYHKMKKDGWMDGSRPK
jgi:hypothetical protein